MQEDRNLIYRKVTEGSSSVQPRSTFPITKTKLESLLSLPLNINSYIKGNSSLGYLSLEEFLLKAIEAPEHIPTRFKLGYKENLIDLYEGVYIQVKDDIFSFKSLGISNQCSISSSKTGLITIPVKYIYFIEIYPNSYNWKPNH